MESNPIGIVISTQNTPSTLEFSFAIKKSFVKKGEFVQVRDERLGVVLGIVTEIIKSNRYFERAESVVQYLDKMDQFPTDEWDYTIANVRVYGVLDKKLMRASTPIKCGLEVFRAEETQLNSLLNFDESGLNIGKLRHYELDVKINLSKLFQKHLAILAMSGSGKSYLASVLMEELLERKLSKIAVVVIDSHGEYKCFENSIYKNKTNVIDCSKTKIALKNLSATKIEEWTAATKLSKRFLNKHIKILRDEMIKTSKEFELDDLYKSIENDNAIKTNTKEPLLECINDLKNLKLISKKDTINQNIIKPANLIVFDLSNMENIRKKQMIVSYYFEKLFKKRKRKKIPPFLLVVEEAHNFCPEKMQRSNALARSIINTIAREGRKFGASLCLISQRPVQLSTTALSQCNSNIILRITNPYDLEHIKKSCEGIDSNSANSITTLKVGEALIIGDAVGTPIFVDVRKRRSDLDESAKTLDDIAIEYEKKLIEEEEQIEAYLY